MKMLLVMVGLLSILAFLQMEIESGNVQRHLDKMRLARKRKGIIDL